jgi:hypothetical protein
LSIFRHLRLIHACYFSKPKSDRTIYRAVRRGRVRKIVELGIGTGRRALRMIRVAKLASPGQDVTYVGVDLFEGRPETAGPALSLKAAHQLLSGAGARIQLVPGDPSEALPRIANSLGTVDLVIVPAELESPSQARFWFFVPRMLSDRTLVLIQQVLDQGQTTLSVKERQDIDALASTGAKRRAA